MKKYIKTVQEAIDQFTDGLITDDELLCHITNLSGETAVRLIAEREQQIKNAQESLKNLYLLIELGMDQKMAILPAQDNCPEIEFDPELFFEDRGILMKDLLDEIDVDYLTLTDLKTLVTLLEDFYNG